MPAASPIRRTPLQHWHVQAGGQLVEKNGWLVPAHYSSFEQELDALRTGVGMIDLSACRKDSLLGDGVCDLAAQLPGEGRANQIGGLVNLDSDGSALACRLRSDLMFVLGVNPVLPHGGDVSAFERIDQVPVSHAIRRHDVTATYACFALLGPRSEVLFRRLMSLDVSIEHFAVGSCAQTSMAAVHVVIFRWEIGSYPVTGLCIAWDLAEYLWDELLSAGQDCGVVPVGIDAWSSFERA